MFQSTRSDYAPHFRISLKARYSFRGADEELMVSDAKKSEYKTTALHCTFFDPQSLKIFWPGCSGCSGCFSHRSGLRSRLSIVGAFGKRMSGCQTANPYFQPAKLTFRYLTLLFWTLTWLKQRNKKDKPLTNLFKYTVTALSDMISVVHDNRNWHIPMKCCLTSSCDVAWACILTPF